MWRQLYSIEHGREIKQRFFLIHIINDTIAKMSEYLCVTFEIKERFSAFLTFWVIWISQFPVLNISVQFATNYKLPIKFGRKEDILP